jgi:hypothetical protein
MANFQYDFAVERNERTQLHGDLIALKAEMIPQIKSLKQGLDSASQDMRSEILSIQSAYSPTREAATFENPQEKTAVDLSTIKEIIKDEVVQIFSEHQARHKQLTETIQVMSAQEKNARLSDVAKVHDLYKELKSRLDAQAVHGVSDPRHKDNMADNLTRTEFDSESRRIWEAIAPDNGMMIPRDEFEDNLQRLWEAIMQLQAKQLEDLKRETRETALHNGYAVDSSQLSSPRKHASVKSSLKLVSAALSTGPAVSPSMVVRTEVKQSSPSSTSRQSGSSPYRAGTGRSAYSTVPSIQQSPLSAGSGTSIFSAPTALLNEPAPASISDVMTPRTALGRRTPVAPHMVHRQGSGI